MKKRNILILRVIGTIVFMVIAFSSDIIAVVAVASIAAVVIVPIGLGKEYWEDDEF